MSEFEVVLKRQWDLLQGLATSEKGLTLHELAIQFGVSEKTIKRDVMSIESVFGQLTFKNEAHGRKRYRYENQFFAFNFILNREELMALYVGQKLMAPLDGTALGKAISSGREKIANSLRKENVEIAERIAPFCYQFDPRERRYSEKTLKAVDAAMAALDRCCVLKISYRSLKSQFVKTYEICPYNFVYWRNSVYLVGLCLHDKKIKIWKIDRLYDATVMDRKKFKRPADFNVDDYLKNVIAPYVGNDKVVTATIRFTDYAARIVQEERFKNVRSIEQEESGAVIMTLDTEDNPAFLRWVLSFGVHAEILSPPELRKEFLDEIGAIKKAYAENENKKDLVAYYKKKDKIVTPSEEDEEVVEVAPDDDNSEVRADASSEEEYNIEIVDLDHPVIPIKRKRGRPRIHPLMPDRPKRRRGRPKGSRNKPKNPELLAAAAAAPTPVEPENKPEPKPVKAAEPVKKPEPVKPAKPAAPTEPEKKPEPKPAKAAAPKKSEPVKTPEPEEKPREKSKVEELAERRRRRQQPLSRAEMLRRFRNR